MRDGNIQKVILFYENKKRIKCIKEEESEINQKNHLNI